MNKTLITACAFSIIITLFPSATFSADRLPFPDGTYASKPKFCKMSRDQAYMETEAAFYDIKGKKISLYESSCAVRDVNVKGNLIKFKKICESEGESSVTSLTWNKLGANKFADEWGTVWVSCDKFIR